MGAWRNDHSLRSGMTIRARMRGLINRSLNYEHTSFPTHCSLHRCPENDHRHTKHLVGQLDCLSKFRDSPASRSSITFDNTKMVKANIIDRETIRKRGWSIHSEVSDAGDKDDLNDDEKKALLDSFPTMDNDTSGVPSHPPPPRKRQKNHEELAPSQTPTMELAKSKLSKWAARLFDPSRPRGLVEAPHVIPLNDEFLQAFGRREKKYDQALGRTIDIDTTNLDEDNDNDMDDQNRIFEADLQPTANVHHGCKVKIVNLAYTTTLEVLNQSCIVYGPLVDVNLVMDKDSLLTESPRNIGRAYVTFQLSESATACVEQFTTLHGRPLRVSLADDAPKKPRKSLGNGGIRYWETDISTKCYRCGQVGHLAIKCMNDAKATPCALCGETNHEIRDCPLGRICFKCGAPGHIIRDCNERYPVKRMICSICFESGLHKVQCRKGLNYASSQDALCMVCHQRGHFMCQEMKWFFGLDGITCFNCGSGGHHGYDCSRPKFEELLGDGNLIFEEMDLAETISL